MKPISLCLPFIVSFFICSCANSAIERIKSQLNKDTSNQLNNVTVKNVHSPDMGFDWFPKRRASLGLADLEKGVDGFELRIWDDSNYPKGRLIIFKHTDHGWAAKECKYKYEQTESKEPDSLSGKFVLREVPKSGWDTFINHLLDLNALTLRDFQSIHDYNVASDELPVIVEIGSNNYYRLYELPSPDMHTNITDATKIIKILAAVTENYPIQ
jgi:hypothetical protein